MKIITWNVNGLRSIYRSDFTAWAERSGADVICLQEVKGQEADVSHLPLPQGYRLLLNCAERKGYSGVACYVKKEPRSVGIRLGHERFDREGRLLELNYPRFTLLNLYIPNGNRDKRDIPYKLEAYARVRARAMSHLRKGTPLLLVGDFNVARHDIDLARPKENRASTMFTPEERKALEQLLATGLTDGFRKLHPDEPGRYTWWPYFANARPRNIGWRIDYAFASATLATRIKTADILDQVGGSDHCPVVIEI